MAVKRTKLGMKIEGPKKPSPYEIIGGRTLKGMGEQKKLERQGTKRLAQGGYEEEITRSQARIPRVKPSGERRRGTKA